MKKGVAYKDRYLHLPKNKVNVRALKAALTMTPTASYEREAGMRIPVIEAFKDEGTHLRIPRYFFTMEELETLDMEVVEAQLEFKRVQYTSDVTPRNQSQAEAICAMLDYDSGIIEMSCGKGKSVIAVHALAMLEVPTIIIVHNASFIDQWSAEIENHLGVKPAVVRGDKREFGDLTIAMLQTLAQNEWDQEELDRFGMAIFDEAHHLAAPLFNTVCPMFSGKRFGLTATTDREDGLEDLYFHHLGPVRHSDLSMDLIPDVHFIKTGVMFTHEEMEEIRVKKVVNVSKLRSALAAVAPRNDLILKEIAKARANGRKILVLGHIVNHLKLLHAQTPGSGLCIGKVPAKKRGDILRNHDVVFGTIALAAEGLDAPWLDTLYIVSPFKATGLFRQSLGRIQRQFEGKMTPTAVIFQDNIKVCMGMLAKMKKFLKEEDIPFHVIKWEEDNDTYIK